MWRKSLILDLATVHLQRARDCTDNSFQDQCNHFTGGASSTENQLQDSAVQPVRQRQDRIIAAAARVNKVGGTGSCDFPTDSCKFPLEDITGAPNFNSAPKFPLLGEFFSHRFCISRRKFSDKREIFRRTKIPGKDCPHDAADDKRRTE